ncbi:MAG TPA: hypothetical protein PLU35_08175 [Phycisphaerales bacterium]|nr:hypothetical protein [Phycisphaerales bacterium]
MELSRWIECIEESLKGFADFDYQRKAWYEGSIPGVVDSFVESVCTFFGYDIDEGLSEWHDDIQPDVLRALQRFRDEFGRFLENTKDDPKIDLDPHSDPRWPRIVELAQNVLSEAKEKGWYSKK